MKFSILALSSFLLVAACSASQAVSNSISCDDVCDRYATCYGGQSYDTDACKARCKSNANNSADSQDNLNQCDDCIGDKSCVSATFNCASSCGSIVP